MAEARVVGGDHAITVGQVGNQIAVLVRRAGKAVQQKQYGRVLRAGEVRQVLVASPDYLAQHGVPATVYELRVHDIVAFEGLSRTSEWRFGQDGKQIVAPTPRLHVNSADAAIAAVEAGLGIVRVYSYQVADAVAAGRLRILLEGSEPPAVPAQLVFSAARADNVNVRRFIDAMAHGKSGIRF